MNCKNQSVTLSYHHCLGTKNNEIIVSCNRTDKLFLLTSQ